MDLDHFFNSFEELVSTMPEDQGPPEFVEFVNKLHTFLRELSDADKMTADQVLMDLESNPEETLFNQVGKILRRFHDQMLVIKEGIPDTLGKIAQQDVSDVSGKLYHIIEMTDKAANTTLDLAENLMADLGDQNEQVENLIPLLEKEAGNAGLPDATRTVLSEAVETLKKTAQGNNDNQTKLTDILIAQDYQDLTGQVIHKILKLLETLETDLADLIQKFGQTEQLLQKAEEEADAPLQGPLQDSHEGKSDQNDVDSLLSQFGF